MVAVFRKRGAITKDFPRKQEFLKHVCEHMENARRLFSEFDLHIGTQVPVVFVARGRAAGMCKWRRTASGIFQYNLEFNINAIMKEWDDMVNDTVPHEIAHIVDHVIHGKSHGHGYQWKAIARRLGCSGDRCHSYEIEKARKTTKIQYVASCGTEIWLTKRIHNQVQNGQVRIISRTRGKITAEHCRWNQTKV